MEIVIRIPDKVFEAYKHWDENKVATVEQTLIANGTPYNPTGDAISREALKNNEPHYDEEGYRVFYESEIDNAQAAEPEYVYLAKVTFDENKLKELTDDIVERIKNGEIVLKDERTNEWTWKPLPEPYESEENT